MAVSTKLIFDAISSQHNIVYIYGGYCESVTKYIAESVSYFNLWQVTHGKYYGQNIVYRCGRSMGRGERISPTQ